jgi:hypothetical protein
MKRYVMFAALVSACCSIPSGCYKPPRNPYVDATEVGISTVGMDHKDYQILAESIARKMMVRGLNDLIDPSDRPFVVAMGPVDTRATPYAVDVKEVQDRLEAILDSEGSLRFTSAVDAMAGNSATAEIYKLIEYNWWKNNPIDREDLQKFKAIADIDGILFGRISSKERRLGARGTEVTYTFVWKLANTKTGINLMTLLKDVRKNIR